MTLSSQPSPHPQFIATPQSRRIKKSKHTKHDPSTPRILPESVNVTITDLLNHNLNGKTKTNSNVGHGEQRNYNDIDPFNQGVEAPNEDCLFEETPTADSGSVSDSFEFQIHNTNATFLEETGVFENTVRFIDDLGYTDDIIEFPLVPINIDDASVSKNIATEEPIVSSVKKTDNPIVDIVNSTVDADNPIIDTINPIVFNIPQNDLPYIETDVGKIYYNGNIDDIFSLDKIDNQDSTFCADYHPEVQWNEDYLKKETEEKTEEITDNATQPLETYVYEEVTKISVEKASRIPKSKRARPKFTSTKQLQGRIDNYYKCVSQEIENTGAMAKSKMYELGYRLVDASYFKNNIITPLLPNNADIEDFNGVQGDNGYIYEYSGAETASDLLALRWTHQRQNFYEPKIVRYRINEDTGKIVDKEALCPYCPVDVTNGLDKCFHNINMSHYMHHVCKNHGVFSTGEEMPVPAFCEKGNKYFSYCSTCGEYQKLSIRLAPDRTKANDNGLISYFRHQYKEHNRTRKMRNATEKEALQRWYSESTSPLIYEAEIPYE